MVNLLGKLGSGVGNILLQLLKGSVGLSAMFIRGTLFKLPIFWLIVSLVLGALTLGIFG